MSVGINSKISSTIATTDTLREVKSAKGEMSDKILNSSFADTLSEQVAKSELKAGPEKSAEVKSKPILQFSNHALERMNSRGIHFTPDQITKIEQGMQKAGEKGAKESLVLTEDSALIVSLKNNTVVTVMDRNMLKENVFTNIDSTVFV